MLRDYLKEKQLGQVRSEGTFITEYRKDWVKGSLIPDVLVYLEERLQSYKKENPDWEDKPYVLVPDIAIEVVSKNDSYSEINEKVGAYLEAGVKEIWVIDPQAKNAFIHSPKKTQMLQKDESIKSTVLPDFELKLADLFGKV
jgi:Uma2 family endonuclease